MKIDLTIPEYAYMFGFFQADGNLYQDTRNRGKFTISLNSRDEHILYSFQKMISVNSSIKTRIRDTKFKKNFISSTLSICNLEFRTLLNQLGIPYGKKSAIIKSPIVPYSKIDYYRGLIDGDGSLGLTKKGFPFISLTTYSDDSANDYKQFIYDTIGVVNNGKRNQRDHIYNLILFNKDAQCLAKILYPDGCLCLKRKFKKMQKMLSWTRPKNWKKETRIQSWTPEQDQYIQIHAVKDSMQILNRSKQSIEMRLWRLRKVQK
jgi:hypothetical protein